MGRSVSVDDVLERLAALPGVRRAQDRPSTLLVTKHPGRVIQIDVSSGALEWYVAVYDQKDSVLWNEWMDYAGYDSTPREELEAQMCGDLSWFTETLVRADEFRTRLHAKLFFFARIIPEVLIEGRWSELQMFHREKRSA